MEPTIAQLAEHSTVEDFIDIEMSSVQFRLVGFYIINVI